MRKTKIGVMDFHGSVDITDPCYNKDVWCRMNNVKISEGEYACYVWRHTDKGKYEDGTPYSYLLVGAIGIIWSVLTKVFERSQRPPAKLHLVKDYQRFFLYDGLTCDMGQNRYQIIGADVFLKGFVQLWIGFKVEVCHIFIVGAPELQNGIGLSDLSCAL